MTEFIATAIFGFFSTGFLLYYFIYKPVRKEYHDH